MHAPEWQLPEKAATPPRFFTRRKAIWTGVAAAAGGAWWHLRGFDADVLAAGRGSAGRQPLDAPCHPDFADAGQPATRQIAVARHVNYYEFNPRKIGTWRRAAALRTSPWEIAVGGLARKPFRISVEELERRFGLEQRVYRHRCVETWAMVVPWLGVSLRKLVAAADPLPAATHVRFVTGSMRRFADVAPPDEYQWPYVEGLTLPEATNELAFLATGAYGERLLKQNGAPVRLVVPWKYGFKSAKSIVAIDFVAGPPGTFWHIHQGDEYGFYANVDPARPHPRWSQATEWMIDTGERFPTRPYNGYGAQVAALYRGNEI